ncbi:MAG: NAD(P)/FAD-dependent oxidoreductase [Patescibacteria group bacterium]|nr:MAG: NAD(P)/FAD-dependent oxidoreductase [Patescibacteria group bacterium]
MGALARKKYDAIVIGGGHNGLVFATYLGQAGKKVLLLEQRHILGGACVSEPFSGFPEALQTTASYVLSIFPRKIMYDLGLEERGLTLLDRDPNAFTPLRDGRYLMRYDDPARTTAQIAKFSERDALNYAAFERSIARVARFAAEMMFMTPPDPFRKRDWFKLLSLGRKVLGLGQEDFSTLVELFSVSAYDYVRRYVRSEPLVGTICSDGIIGTCGGPRAPGTAYVLLHHDIGDLADEPGKWFYVQGGMGGVADSLANAARAAGVEIVVNADVQQILVNKNGVEGVAATIEGTPVNIASKAVVSSADAYQTFVRMLPPGYLPIGFLGDVKRIDYSSPTWKVNMVVEDNADRHLKWFCNYKGPTPPGTIHLIGEGADDIERAYDDMKYGKLSKHPVLEICVPTTRDMTLAPRGYHVLSILGQYAPFDTPRELLLERTLATMEQYCNIRDVLVTADVLSPKDMEERFRLTGGNIFQGAMPLKQLFSMRPLPGWARYRSPVKNLWMCGSACHPGGGVTGIPGHNAAREFLKKGW